MKKISKIIIIIVVFIIVILGALIIFVNIEDKPINLAPLEPQFNTLNPKLVSIDGFPIIRQPDSTTCGITTISMVVSYLTEKTANPKDLIDKYKISSGMSIDKMKEILSNELPNYDFVYKYNLSNFDLLMSIYEQVGKGIPVPVFFGAPNPYNKPHYDFHASVVTGMNVSEQTVEIANAYGYSEKIDFIDFLNRTTYSNINSYPIVQKVVSKLGLQQKNTVILIKMK